MGLDNLHIGKNNTWPALFKKTLWKLLTFPFGKYLLLRTRVWLRIMRRLRGITVRDNLAIYLSAIMDIGWCMFHPRTLRNPICRFSCMVYAPKFGVHFYIRERSDDLYSILPEREGDVHRAILELLSEGDVFVDVGANIGYYTILASRKVGKTGRVIAIEAFPENVKQLKKHVEMNGATNVDIVEAAVWSSSGEELKMRFWDGFYGWVSAKNEYPRARLAGGREVTVFTRRLDDICKDCHSIKLLKLDIEGAEYEALKGAQKTLLKARFVISESEQNQREIFSLLTESGFRVRKMNFTTYIMAERNQTEQLGNLGCSIEMGLGFETRVLRCDK